MANSPAAIDLSNFAVVKFGNLDAERNYVNAILHAIVGVTDDLQSQLTDLSGGGDTTAGQVITAVQDSTLPNSRVLQGESGVFSLVDNGPGSSFTIQLSPNGVDNTKLAQMVSHTFKANKESITGNPEDITGTQATALLDEFTASEKGLVPPPGLSPAAGWYLHYDGTWSSPGGGSTTVATVNSGTGITVDNTDPSNPIVNITNTGVTATSYGDSTHWPTYTVNAQGQLTISGSQAAPTSLPPSGTAGGDLTGTYPNPTLVAIVVGATVGDSTHIPTFTFDNKGRITAASSNAITVPTGANPTASVGLAAVNGSAVTFLRSDGAPALSQAIVPTWVGVHTFTPQAVFTGGLTTGGNVTILTDIVAGSGNIECGSLGHVRSIGGWTTYSSVDQFYVGFTADADPPAIARVFVSKGDNTAGKIDALQLEIGTGNTAVGKSLFLNGFITPTALASGNTDDWNPIGLSTACVIRVTPNASGSTLRGITAPTFAGTDIGKTLHMLNVGTANLTLSNQSIGSTAANRLILGSTSLVIAPGQGIVFWYDSTSSRWRVLDTIVSTSGFQSAIQIQDEGSNQGSAGDATTWNFTGSAVTASISGATATINIDTSSLATAINLCGGTGEDGNVDLDGTNTYSFLNKSGNIYTTNRNVAMARLRITTGCTLQGSGGHISVQQWVATTGFYGRISIDGGAGTNATGVTNGVAGSALVGSTNYFAAGQTGTNGSLGVTGTSASTGAVAGSSQGWGGAGAKGGKGGAGNPGLAGNTGSINPVTGYNPVSSQFSLLQTNSGAAYTAANGGSGGTGGGGDNTNSGGGGGGGGGPGCGLDISIGEILTDGSTPAGLLTANGGRGGNGANGAGTGNTGGGGGGGAGGGGALRLVLGKRTGPAVAGFLQANGGDGGTAGLLHGTGANGTGGDGASNGRLFYYNAAATTWAVVITVSTGAAGSGTTGGAGALASLTL